MPTSPFPTFSLVEGRLVLQDDKVNGKLKPNTDYNLAHTAPASKAPTQKTTGAYFAYTTDDSRPGGKYPLFDVIWLPNCQGVALKQRDLNPSMLCPLFHSHGSLRSNIAMTDKGVQARSIS